MLPRSIRRIPSTATGWAWSFGVTEVLLFCSLRRLLQQPRRYRHRNIRFDLWQSCGAASDATDAGERHGDPIAMVTLDVLMGRCLPALMMDVVDGGDFPFS